MQKESFYWREKRPPSRKKIITANLFLKSLEQQLQSLFKPLESHGEKNLFFWGGPLERLPEVESSMLEKLFSFVG